MNILIRTEGKKRYYAQIVYVLDSKLLPQKISVGDIFIKDDTIYAHIPIYDRYKVYYNKEFQELLTTLIFDCITKATKRFANLTTLIIPSTGGKNIPLHIYHQSCLEALYRVKSHGSDVKTIIFESKTALITKVTTTFFKSYLNQVQLKDTTSIDSNDINYLLKPSADDWKEMFDDVFEQDKTWEKCKPFEANRVKANSLSIQNAQMTHVNLLTFENDKIGDTVIYILPYSSSGDGNFSPEEEVRKKTISINKNELESVKRVIKLLIDNITTQIVTDVKITIVYTSKNNKGVMKNCNEIETQEFIFQIQSMDYIPSKRTKDMKRIALVKTEFGEKEFAYFLNPNPDLVGVPAVITVAYINKLLEQDPMKNICYYSFFETDLFILPSHVLLSDDSDILLTIGTQKHVWLCYVHKLTKTIFVYENYMYRDDYDKFIYTDDLALNEDFLRLYNKRFPDMRRDFKIDILNRLKFYFSMYTIDIDVNNQLVKSAEVYPLSCGYSTMYFAKTLLNTPREERFGWVDPPKFELCQLRREIEKSLREILVDNREYFEIHDEINKPKKIHVMRDEAYI